jgi:hypothetical protein
MPYNGTGLFVRLYSWVQDAANSIKISSSRMDAEFDGIADALSNAMTRDGQGPASGNLNLGGFKIINMAPGVAPNDAATVSQIAVPSFPARSVVSAAAGVAQTNIGSAATKVMFGNNVYDALGEFSAANSRFTASAAGPHYVNASVIMKSAAVSGAGPNFLKIYKNGAPAFGVSFSTVEVNASVVVPIGAVVAMNPGDFIEIWALFVAGVSTNALQPNAAQGGYSQLTVSRVG